MKMTPKASGRASKTSQWEKIRRDKLNESFTTLGKLLPNYDPSITLSKSEILHKAASYIEELQLKIKGIGAAEGVQKTMRTEVKSLYERIKKLIQRNEQLSLFIRDAGMKVPKYYGNTKQFKRSFCWTNKISEAHAKELSKKELEAQKENREIETKKKRNRGKNGQKKLHQKHTKRSFENCIRARLIAGIQVSNIVQTTSVSVPAQECILITSEAPLNLSRTTGEQKLSTTTVVTSSPSSSTPKVSSIINRPVAPANINTDLNTLGPGTLILANGNFVRLLPQPPPIIIKPPTKNLVILTTTTSIYTRSHTNIRPKARAFTKTTQITTFPISSLAPYINPRRKGRAIKRYCQISPVAKVPAKQAKPNTQTAETNTATEKNDSSAKLAEVETTEKEKLATSSEQPLETDKVNELLDAVNEITQQPKVLEEITKVPETTETVVSATSELIIEAEPQPKETTPLSEEKTKNSEDHLELGMNLNSELSNDIFSSLQVPIGGQNPESTSPTAAFLMAFPLVSSLTGVKVTEAIEEENSSSHNGTPTLLQIGTLETTKTTTQSESLTPNLLNLENFSFFSGYSSFEYSSATTTTVTTVHKAAVTCAKTFAAEEPVPDKTNNFSCAQETTSVTYSKVGSVSTPYVQCANQSQNQPNHQNQERKQVATVNPPKPYVAVTSVQCNTFNTFTDFSKPSSNTYPIKSYTNPVYTNSSSQYNYTQNPYGNNNNNNQYYSKTASTTTYQRYNYYNTTATKTNQPKEKFSPPKNNKNQPKPPINWMTTPDFRGNTTDNIVPPVQPLSKDLDYNTNAFYPPPVVTSHTNYFNNTNSHEFQQNTTQYDENNQFSWSPTKLPQYLDTPHNFVTTTLPTLIGDLALGTTSSSLDQNLRKTKDRNKTRINPANYDTNPSNFLSVSQLVEHKTDRNNRRNTRNIKTNQKLKKLPENSKEQQLAEIDKKQAYPNWLEGCSNKATIRHGSKNTTTHSNYSAEALIGHQELTDTSGSRQRYRQNFGPPNKTLPAPTYLSENIVPPYFPPVEISQENFIPPSNQNYQNFTQNAASASYLPDFSTTPHDYTNTSNRPNNDCSLKKLNKHKPANENLSMDFGFLSMPGSINSPILPDDFHAHANFLATPTPNQLYPCKNPLYPKQSSDLLALPPVPVSRSTTQQFENMPGSALTNFNLSAIFPEMNKGSGMYSTEPTRNKNYNFHYLGSSVQTTFHNKSMAATSSYVNTTATTFAPTN